MAVVKRNGKWCEIAVRDLVLGDVIALKGGDIIPADCRVSDPSYLGPCSAGDANSVCMHWRRRHGMKVLPC